MERRNWLWALPAAIGVMAFKAKDEETEKPMIHESIKIVHTDGTVYYPMVAKHIEEQERIGNGSSIIVNGDNNRDRAVLHLQFAKQDLPFNVR